MLHLHLKHKLNMIAPDQRYFEIIHYFGVFANKQCERKLTEMLSDLLAADIEYHLVPYGANSTNS